VEIPLFVNIGLMRNDGPTDHSGGTVSAAALDTGVVSGIVGIVDTADRRVLVLRRFDTDREYPSHWCFPGGQVRTGETTREAAAREAEEETGLTVRSLEFVGQRESIGATGRTYVIDCFLAESWSGSLMTFPSAEHAAATWVPIEDLGLLEPSGPATRWLASMICSRFARGPRMCGSSDEPAQLSARRHDRSRG
jgi:8-oxo-dGTP pyrophosphatase MutT (NUDIX family)